MSRRSTTGEMRSPVSYFSKSLIELTRYRYDRFMITAMRALFISTFLMPRYRLPAPTDTARAPAMHSYQRTPAPRRWYQCASHAFDFAIHFFDFCRGGIGISRPGDESSGICESLRPVDLVLNINGRMLESGSASSFFFDRELCASPPGFVVGTVPSAICLISPAATTAALI